MNDAIVRLPRARTGANISPLWPLLLLSLCAGRASAQAPAAQPAVTAAPATATTPSEQPAATTAPAAAPSTAAAPPAPATAPDPVFARAEPHIRRGEALFDSGNANAALAEFQRALQLLAGHEQQYQVLYNIGLCHERLFHYGQALLYFDRYLAAAGSRADDKAAVTAAIQSFKELLGKIDAQSNTPVQVWMDDQQVGTAPGELVVPGGTHTLEFRARGYESEKRELTLPAGERIQITVVMRPIEHYRGLSPVVALSVGGAALVAVGIGSVFGAQALSKRSDADEPGARLKNTPDVADEIAELQTKADTFFIAAGVLAVGAGVLAFLTDWHGKSADEPHEGSPPPKLGVSVGPDRAAVGLELKL